jgi:light-regulated signal transduction histidine kinase (bacteriophytochrome)
MSKTGLCDGETLTDKHHAAEGIRNAGFAIDGPAKAHTMKKIGSTVGQNRALDAQLEQMVLERTADLRMANQQMEAFIFSASHDLRAPLRHMIGYVEILQTEAEPALSEANLSYVAKISGAAGRMGKLIDALHTFSRLGKLEMRKANVDLAPLVQEVVGDFQMETKHRNIAWEIGSMAAVKADRCLLRHALANLISNAVKFTSVRAEARIEIGCAPSDGNETIIFIRDNGAGFNPLQVHKLFGMFQRLHSEADFEGVGIGLANVRNIVHRHGGRTWAEGAVNDGATFFFSIPNRHKQPYCTEDFPSGA